MSSALIRTLQRRLYQRGQKIAVDGLEGPETLTALDRVLPELVVPTKLRQPKAFYDTLRGGLYGPTISPEELNGTEALLAAMGGAGWPLAWTAYGLATAYHECDVPRNGVTPVEEYGKGHGKPYGRDDPPGSGKVYYGRGFVQLTWRRNYEAMERLLGVPLAAQPELALQPAVAARILVVGMERGTFTGKSLNNLLMRDRPATAEEFRRARPIINGTDKDTLIAGYAAGFQTALQRGEWGEA